MYYPVFLNLKAARCLVVGAGEVGLRKIERLLECGIAQVLVLDLAEPSPKLKAKLEDNRISFEKRTFTEKDLEGRLLVFAATSNNEVNANIADLCAQKGILCNCIDSSEAGSFILPAIASHGRITAAISTGGASPAQAKVLKEDLKEWLSTHSALTELLGRLRPLVLALGNDSRQNSILFRKLATSGLQEALSGGDKQKSLAIMRDVLPVELHRHIGDLL